MGLISALFGLFIGQSYVQIPDGYAIDVDRDPPRFAAPCDRDNVVSVEIPTKKILGDAKLSLRYDEEDRSMGRDGDVLMLRLQYRFD
jgi:hypothetical protein